MGKPEGNRPLGRPRRRWVGNIKMDLREIGWDGVDWTDMAQGTDQWGALVITVLNLLFTPFVTGSDVLLALRFGPYAKVLLLKPQMSSKSWKGRHIPPKGR
jgi:hypothetical protein